MKSGLGKRMKKICPDVWMAKFDDRAAGKCLMPMDVKAWHLRALQGLTTLAVLETCAIPKHNLSILYHSLNQED